MQSLFVWVSIGAALLLSSIYSRNRLNDRSTLEILVCLICSAIALSWVQHKHPSVLNPTISHKDGHDVTTLKILGQADPDVQTRQPGIRPTGLSVRGQSRLMLIAIFALAARIDLHKKITETAQCRAFSWQVLIPLALAINESRFSQLLRTSSDTVEYSTTRKPFNSKLARYLSQTAWRNIIPSFVLCYGCYLEVQSWTVQNSTIICPIVSRQRVLIPALEKVRFILDCLLAIIAQELAYTENVVYHRVLHPVFSYATILASAVLCYITYMFFLYLFSRGEIQWLLINDDPSVLKTTVILFWHGALVSMFVVSSTHCVFQYGVFATVTFSIASVTLFFGLDKIWSLQSPFPPALSELSFWPFILIHLGGWLLYHGHFVVGQTQQSRSLMLWSISSLVVLFVLLLPGLRATNGVHFHPIELLMFDAKYQHEQYIAYADRSTTLRSAVAIYRERYQNEPPPGFDKWYDFARKRSVLIMDDYDQIHRDLLPFRAVSPSTIRESTWKIASNPWNELQWIRIRSGKAEVQENGLPLTHRWMADGVIAMINTFVEHLPDMDLAFNVNDEPRVAVSNRRISSLHKIAGQIKLQGHSGWSTDRSSTWPPPKDEQYQKTVFENLSFRKNFRRYGSINCPSNSLSITQPHLSSKSEICLECVAPHSFGQFLSNWTLAADMCHQPDMSHLHGLYLSPAAFKPTHELMPVFSQSKASGYNDILYPSPWNYLEKVKYQPVNASGEEDTESYSPGFPDPPFTEKENLLYWRGTTSEGVSEGYHAWQGMTRQRLVHLINNATTNANYDQITLLLPDPKKPEAYTYHSFPGSATLPLGLHQSADIKIVDQIVRCGAVDCTDQAQEFALVEPVDFQAHWKYKFLFDMDGAGFSGRFLPFLQSRSVPFKAALFREWYDSRLTAWRHFVPIDMRLHGLWSTLAYFTGIDGVWPGTGEQYKWEAHTSQAEIIAEEGRRWAGRVLRKEDMEVYFFRLLLEWGRLTDDRRDELGFALP